MLHVVLFSVLTVDQKLLVNDSPDSFILVKRLVLRWLTRAEVMRTCCEGVFMLSIHLSPITPLLCLSLALLQIVAAILAIAGIVMMTYADGFHSHSVIGITFVVASASMSALYKVCLSIRQHYCAHKTFLK